MARDIIFGEINGIEEGYWFKGRKEMMPSSFHRSWVYGIDGNEKDGTSAIVLSGGYEDDIDDGEEIIYTGQGGRDQTTGKQIADQSWSTPGNAGLLKSMDEGLPVRVIRGYSHKSPYSPKEGYTYAGLYSVVDAWIETGKSGYKICRIRLEYCGNNPNKRTPEEVELNDKRKKAIRKLGTVVRIVRDTAIAHKVKSIYNHECQVCNITIKTKSGRYSEGAHIKPLGKPHNGDDNSDNMLCLCPNHHVMFDKGSFSISDDLTLVGDVSGTINLHKSHKLNVDNLKYHRNCHGYN